jgi:hypothetical protein
MYYMIEAERQEEQLTWRNGMPCTYNMIEAEIQEEQLTWRNGTPCII